LIELLEGSTPGLSASPPSRQIIIGERGWVFVGDVARDGGDYILSNASVIRVWGTKNGIGQLAKEGKQPSTILDPCGTVRIPELAVIARLDVEKGVNL
jgi:hypothetical protein